MNNISELRGFDLKINPRTTFKGHTKQHNNKKDSYKNNEI